MRLIMVPVIFSIGFLMFEQRDKVMDLYHAAYPVDPIKSAELSSCAENPNFNRLDSGDRAACYAGTYGKREEPALIPTPQPTYAYSPSHLPANDIRREEANTSYLRGSAAIAEGHAPAQHLALHPTPPHQYTYQPLDASNPTTTRQ